ncbi:MAG: hypothetical protein R6U17_01250 [Thermoplasmata archaeon]
MDRDVFKDRKILALCVVAVVVLLLIYSIYYTSLFNGDSETGDESDWTDYPYVIPGTDMRFPDVEGKYTPGDTWLSLGFELDFIDSDKENAHLALLYHPKYKDVFLSTSDDIFKTRFNGERTLPVGKIDMTFDAPGLPEDSLRVKDGQAFHYDLLAHFEIDGTLYRLDVELESIKPPATMFDGQVVMGNEYYKLHALSNCVTTGTLSIGEDVHGVTGQAWFENQRGTFGSMKWNWFCFFGDDDTEMEIVDLYGPDEQNFNYAMYIQRNGEVLTIDDISIETTSFIEPPSSPNKFGYSWEIFSSKYYVSLNITSVEEDMYYNGYAVGVGRVTGTLMGREIDTWTYVEQTKLHF